MEAKVVRNEDGRVRETRSNVNPSTRLGFAKVGGRYEALPIGTTGVEFVSVSEAQGRRARARYDETLRQEETAPENKGGNSGTNQSGAAIAQDSEDIAQVEAGVKTEAILFA